MSKKVYETVRLLLDDLSSAEDTWKSNPIALEEYINVNKMVLGKAGYGKTNDELIKSLLVLISSLATQPDNNEDYPVISFMSEDDG